MKFDGLDCRGAAVNDPSPPPSLFFAVARTGDDQCAEDNFEFLKGFFGLFPQFAANDFFVRRTCSCRCCGLLLFVESLAAL